MSGTVRQFGDWKTVERKLKSAESEARALVADSSKDIPAAYQKTIQSEIIKWQVEPKVTAGVAAFDAKTYADEVKPDRQLTGDSAVVYVGLQEPMRPEIREFALSEEYESAEHLGLWRKASNRFLAKLDSLQNYFLNKAASWNVYRRRS